MKSEKKRTHPGRSQQKYSITDMNGRRDWGHYSYLDANGETHKPSIFSYLDANGKAGRKSFLYSLLCMNGLLKNQRQ